MKRIALLLIVVIMTPAWGQITFYEGFEGALDKWEILGSQSGEVEKTISYAHSGGSSLMIRTTQIGGTGESKKRYVRHAFPQNLVGTVSVWFYDGGNPNAALMVLKDSEGNETGIGRMDAAGSMSPGYVYVFGDAEYTGSIPYSLGWHMFSIAVSSEGARYSIDGSLQGAANPTFKNFSEIRLGTFSGVFTEQYWDDVSLAPLCIMSPPTITSPSPGYNFPTSRPSFSWDGVEGADSYAVQILSGETIVDERNGIVGNTYAPQQDLDKGSYTLRIKALSKNCESEWSTLPFSITMETIDFTVKVLNKGAPVFEADVSLIPATVFYFYSQKTDENGMAVFRGLPSGSYALKVEKNSFAPYTSSVQIDESSSIDVELEKTPSVQISADRESYACNETITLHIKGPADSSVALMVRLGEEVVYTDTLKADANGDSSSSFAMAREGELEVTASASGATATARIMVTCVKEMQEIKVSIKEYEVIDAASHPKSTFSRGQMVGFHIVVLNESSNSVSVLVLNQVKDSKLVSVFTGLAKVTLAPGETQEISLWFTLPGSANMGEYGCQAMVWSDWASLGGQAYDSIELTFNVEASI